MIFILGFCAVAAFANPLYPPPERDSYYYQPPTQYPVAKEYNAVAAEQPHAYTQVVQDAVEQGKYQAAQDPQTQNYGHQIVADEVKTYLPPPAQNPPAHSYGEQVVADEVKTYVPPAHEPVQQYEQVAAAEEQKNVYVPPPQDASSNYNVQQAPISNYKAVAQEEPQVYNPPVVHAAPATYSPPAQAPPAQNYGPAQDAASKNEIVVVVHDVAKQAYAPARDAPAYSQNYVAHDAPAYDSRCETKPDGFYVYGCSNTYYACSGSVSTELYCPAGQWYSAETNRCDIKKFVPECGGTVPPPEPDYVQFDHSPANNRCATQDDGLFSIGNCIPEFLHCFGGNGRISTCQDGLVFDVRTGKCDFAEVCNYQYDAPRYEAAADAPAKPYGY